MENVVKEIGPWICDCYLGSGYAKRQNAHIHAYIILLLYIYIRLTFKKINRHLGQHLGTRGWDMGWV
jgi:hypothetical protein